MDPLQTLRDDIRAAQARHQEIAEEVRGLRVPYRRRGEMSIPAFKMAPGGDPRTDGRSQSLKIMAGATRFGVDLFFYDLEDAAPDHPEFKAFARQYAIEALATHDFGKRIVAFRPNNIRTPYFEDDVIEVLRAVGHKLQVIVLPKTETAEEVRDIARLVARAGQLAGLTRPLWLEVLIESPRAWVQAQKIAAIPEVTALIFGAWDFARTVGGEVDATTWLRNQAVARQMLPIVAASEGKEAIDAITGTLPIRPPRPADLDDAHYRRLLELPADALDQAPEALRAPLLARRHALDLAVRDAKDARSLGFAGKWILHPDQIEAIQGAWVPSRPRALQALALTAAYAKAALRGSGAELDGGRLADKAVIGTDWWLVTSGLLAGVLTEADVTQTGLTYEQLARTAVSRDAQVKP
jgi:citrate lyase beta subunit